MTRGLERYCVIDSLFDRNVLLHLRLFLCGLAGELDVEHTMLYLGFDMGLVHIVGEDEGLLKLGVGEFSAEELALLLVAALGILALAVLALAFVVLALLAVFFVAVAALLHRDDQVAGLVEVDAEVVFGHARGCHLHFILVFLLDDVDGWSGGLGASHPVGVEEITEDARYPVLTVHSFHWGHNWFRFKGLNKMVQL